MEAELWIPILAIPILFVALPWIILHYVTRWKANASLTAEDETMLDELYDLARRLDERMATVERIMSDDHPGWNALASERAAARLETRELDDLSTRLGKRRSNAPDLAKSPRRA